MEHNITYLQHALRDLSVWDEALWTALKPHITERHIRKNSFLAVDQADIFFVAQGVIYIQDQRTDAIKHFICKGDLVPDSYLAVHLHYRILEDTTLLVFPKGMLEQVYRSCPAVYNFQVRMLRHWLVYSAYREELLQLEKRVRKEQFKERFPTLPGTIPNMLIAQYLAVTREYFGRTGW